MILLTIYEKKLRLKAFLQLFNIEINACVLNVIYEYFYCELFLSNLFGKHVEKHIIYVSIAFGLSIIQSILLCGERALQFSLFWMEIFYNLYSIVLIRILWSRISSKIIWSDQSLVNVPSDLNFIENSNKTLNFLKNWKNDRNLEQYPVRKFLKYSR